MNLPSQPRISAKNTPSGRVDISAASMTYQRPKSHPVQALLPVDLSIAPNDFISLVGPSGCGKTTLLMMSSGLLKPTTGSILIDGAPVKAGDSTVGIAFQKPTLLRWKTILENIVLPAKIRHNSESIARKRATELLEITGLATFANRYPHELSGGMQQRASIVRALVSDPAVLLMDEPFSALDEFTRDLLNDELLKLWSTHPKTVVFVTHSISEAVYLSDRVVVMAPRPGRVLNIVTVPFARPRNLAIRETKEFNDIVHLVRTTLNNASGLRRS